MAAIQINLPGGPQYFATKTDAVIACRAAGITTREIASRIGIDIKNVTALEHSRGRKRTPRPAEQLGRTVLFSKDILDALAPHAAKRGIHPNNLARKLVEIAIDDGLIDSILDDADA